jgi:4-amino-4-deoxy-L-arabinose transferase-like glycosyltransferase
MDGSDEIEGAGVPERRTARSPRRSTLAIIALALAGLAWRLWYAVDQFAGDDNLFDEGDAFLYSNVAHDTAKGDWFLNRFEGTHFADHPPLTVLSLTPTGWLFPDSVMAQRVTNSLLGALAIVLIGLFARRLAGPAAGIAAAAIAAVSPNLWMNDAVIMSETISTVVLVAVLWAAVDLRRSPTLARAAGTGALCGVAILARAELALLLPLLIVPVVVLARDLAWRERLGRAALAVGVAVAVVAPWTAWNAVEFEDTVLLSTNEGTTLLGSNCDVTYEPPLRGAWWLACVVDFNDEQQTRERGLDASQVSALQRDEALRYVREHAGELPSVVVARLGRTFGWHGLEQQIYANNGEGRPSWASRAGYVSFWILAPLAVAGAVVLRRRGGDLLPAIACLVIVVVVSAAFYGIARFRLPLDVMTIVLAGVALGAVVDRWRGTRSRAAEPFAADRPLAP